MLEPWLFLKGLLVCMWLFILLHQWVMLNVVILSGLPVLLAAMIISVYCIVWVWSPGKERSVLNESRNEFPAGSDTFT